MKKRAFTYSSSQKSKRIQLDLSSNGFQEKNKETKKRAFTDSSPQKSTKKAKKVELVPNVDDKVSRDDVDDVDSSPYDTPEEYKYPERECVEADVDSPPYDTPEEYKYPEIEADVDSPPYDTPERECIEADVRRQNLKCAQTALEYYNKKNVRANYELVDALDSHAFIECHGITLHCNFRAKQKKTKTGTKLFFAELLYPRASIPHPLEATYCCILKGKHVVGCDSCMSSAMHPAYGFQTGLQRCYTYDLRSHSH